MLTGDVLILLERRSGARGRKVLPVGQLWSIAAEGYTFEYKGEQVTATDTEVRWGSRVFDSMVLPGHRVADSSCRVVTRACCAAHVLGVGTSICTKHKLDAEALVRWGGTWRH